MSSPIARFATNEPTLCAVCRRGAVWLGYSAHPHRGPVIWLCDDNGCHAAAKRIYAMSQGSLDAYEHAAAVEAGAQAGSYLDEIGQSDLARLSNQQWQEFLRRIIVGFEHEWRHPDRPAGEAS